MRSIRCGLLLPLWCGSSVCWSLAWAERIEMPFNVWTQAGPRNYLLCVRPRSPRGSHYCQPYSLGAPVYSSNVFEFVDRFPVQVQRVLLHSCHWSAAAAAVECDARQTVESLSASWADLRHRLTLYWMTVQCLRCMCYTMTEYIYCDFDYLFFSQTNDTVMPEWRYICRH